MTDPTAIIAVLVRRLGGDVEISANELERAGRSRVATSFSHDPERTRFQVYDHEPPPIVTKSARNPYHCPPDGEPCLMCGADGSDCEIPF